MRPPPLLTTAQVAVAVSMSTEWVREHAAELGAIKTSDGPGGQLRFEPADIEAWKRRRRLQATAPAPRRRSGVARAPSGVTLLPLPAKR